MLNKINNSLAPKQYRSFKILPAAVLQPATDEINQGWGYTNHHELAVTETGE
jgi:hypothetical protein